MKLTQLTEQKERPYVVFHTKKGKYETHAVSSYDAAKNAAKHWGLKSTAGITPKLADVEHVAEDSDKNCGCGQDPCVTYGNKSHQAESYDDYHGDMSKEEYDKTVKGSEMEYSVWVGGTEVNDNYLPYDEAVRLYDKYKAQGYDDVQLDARIKESVNEDDSFRDRDNFVTAYIAAAEELAGEEFEDGDVDWSPEAMEQMEQDAEDFFAKAEDLLAQTGVEDSRQHGYDFWLTRNGHGVGFWDRGYGEVGDKLTALADKYGSSDMYKGDDGKAYVESINEAEKRWKQTSMSPEEAIEKYGKENVKVKKGALRNGDDMVEVFVESYSPGDEYTDSEGMVSNCCGAPMMDYNDGHGRCGDCKEMAAGESEEEFYESYSNDGKTITISDYQPEGEANAHKKFNLRKQIHRGEDGKAIKSPYGGYKVSFHGSAEDVKAYANNHLGESMNEDEEAIAARDEFLKVMDMKPKSSHKAIDTIKKIVADKQNMQVKFDDGKMKVDLYTASAVAAVYNAVNDVNKEKIDNMLRTKEGMLRMSNFAFSKLKEGIAEGKRIDEILPLVGAIAGAIGRKVAGSAVKNVAKKAAGVAAMGTANAAGSAVGNAAQSSGMNASAKAKGKKLNAVKEAGGYYTQPVYDMIKQHGYPKVMHRLLSALDADVIQDFISREPDLDESVNEADIVGDNYANVYYDYSESFYMIDVYKDGKKVEEYDDYIGANEEGDPIKDKFLELVKKAGLEPEGLNLISTGGDEPDEYGVFKNGKFNWDKSEALPAVGTAVAGGLKKAAGAVGKLANKADTAAFGLKSKDGVKYNANSPQGKMIRNMAKNGKTQGARSDAKKDLVKGIVPGLKKKVGGISGIMKTAAASSGFLPASKQFAKDMVEKAMKDADK